MTTLSFNPAGEVVLTLRGEAEDRILSALRGCPYWIRAHVEHDPANPARCVAVTLVADKMHETVVRDILRRGFGMTFPATGGDVALPDAPPHVSKRGLRR